MANNEDAIDLMRQVATLTSQLELALATNKDLAGRVTGLVTERDEARRQRDEYPEYWVRSRLRYYNEAICPKCSGRGVRAYGSTATWRGGIGGQAITSDVCDSCWGSGSAEYAWPSWREVPAKIAAAREEGWRAGVAQAHIEASDEAADCDERDEFMKGYGMGARSCAVRINALLLPDQKDNT